jgi:hypothetical protein
LIAGKSNAAQFLGGVLFLALRSVISARALAGFLCSLEEKSLAMGVCACVQDLVN